MNTKSPARGKREKNVMVYRNGQSLLDSAGCAPARRRFRYRGVALVWSALLMIVMIGLVGLSIDWGKLAVNVHQMQNAADAAALAGAQIVKRELPEVTRQRTHDFGFANAAEQLAVTLRTTAQPEPFPNPTDWDDPGQVIAYEAAMAPLDIVLGRWVRYNRTFVPTLDAANAVMAIPRRNAALGETAPALALIFGPIAGVDTADAERVAVAWCYDSGGSGLICLSNPVPGGDPGLWITGTADLDIDGGGIHVNADVYGNNGKAGAWISGTALLDMGFINVVGGVDPPPDSSVWEGIFEGGLDDGAVGFSVADGTTIPAPQRVDDPLAAAMNGTAYVAAPGDHLDLPTLIDNGTISPVTQTLEGTPIAGPITTSCTLGPGYYPNGIRITNGITVTLQPSSASGLGTLFVFGGGAGAAGSLGTGLTVNGGTLLGHGVTCYVTKNFETGVLGVTDWGAGSLLDMWSPGDWTNKDDPTPDLSLVQGLNGVVVWQDPTMVDSKGDTPDAHLNGSPEGGVHGTIYFPDPIHIELNGDLGQMGNQILCGSAKINGTATLFVDYDGRNTPRPSNQSILVR